MNKQALIEVAVGFGIVGAAIAAAGLWNGLAFGLLLGALAYDRTPR